MKFKQTNTGTVLEVTNESVIEMMQASDSYVAVDQVKAKPEKSGKAQKPAE